MSIRTQTANMKALAELLSQDLGYIFGERESGPNGAKCLFHTKARAFLTGLRKDLGIVGWKIRTNKAGIAVSGEVTLRGLWEIGNGLRVELTQDLAYGNVMFVGPIIGLDDYASGYAVSFTLETLRKADYASLILDLLAFKEDFQDGWTAA